MHSIYKYRFTRGSLRFVIFAMTLLVVFATAESDSSAAPVQWRFSGVGRVVVIGDVHGAYDALAGLLQETGVVSSNLEWSGGETWLVMLGDLVDRGPRSREVLDLVMRLQRSAPKHGGRVLVVLGNHDVMNMLGQLLFVNEEGFEAFASDEKTATRNRIFKKTLKRNNQVLDRTQARSTFDRDFPAGFFARRAAFSRDGVYGRWLLDQHILISIDGTVYIHGGLAPRLTEYLPDEINRVAMDELRAIMNAQDVLVAANVFGAETDFDEQARPAELYIKDRQESRRPLVRRRVEAAKVVTQMSAALAVSSDGPLWYRGTYLHPQYREDGRASRVLAWLGAKRVVMGHTPSETGRVQVRLDGRAVMADTGMLAGEYSGQASAVIVADGRISAFYPGEQLVQLPDPAPRAVIDQHIAETWESVLATADVLSIGEVGRGVMQSQWVRLIDGKRPVAAIFKSDAIGSDHDQNRYQHEVAAFRIDQLLGFDLVPPTVIRQIEGEEGSLQVWPEDSVDEVYRQVNKIEPAGDSQLQVLKGRFSTFDCLINNPVRDPSAILWGIKDHRPHLIDHSSAFAVGVEMLSCPLVADLDEFTASRLRSLQTGRLRQELKDLLSEAQIEALLNRLSLILQSSH